MDLCTLYIPLTPFSDLERLEAQERQAACDAAATDVEQYDAERGRGREEGRRAPDVVITLPFRITLMLLPREDLGFKLITATGVLIDPERPNGGPENREDGGKNEEENFDGKEVQVDQVHELELSLVGAQLVGATDVYCSICSAWMDRHLGLVPGCC